MGYAATTCLLLCLHRRRLRAASTSTSAAARELAEVALLCALTAAVGYGRVHLGYHTAEQVTAGLCLGAGCAAAVQQLTHAACQRWGPALLRLAPLRALAFRDTLSCRQDVHATEAALFAAKRD